MEQLICPFCFVQLDYTSTDDFLATDSNWVCLLCKRRYRTRQQIDDLIEQQGKIRKKPKKEIIKDWEVIKKKVKILR